MTHTLAKYKQTYLQFQKWNEASGNRPTSENVLLEYFTDLSTRSKPTTLFAIYSMLKYTFRSNDDVDIGSYSRVLEYLKEKNVGYKPLKAKLFTDEDIDRFVNEAPDDRWLDVKVYLTKPLATPWKHLTFIHPLVIDGLCICIKWSISEARHRDD